MTIVDGSTARGYTIAGDTTQICDETSNALSGGFERLDATRLIRQHASSCACVMFAHGGGEVMLNLIGDGVIGDFGTILILRNYT